MVIHNPLAALAAPPPGIASRIDKAAIDAIAGQVSQARAVVGAVEPLIVQDVVDRIVRNATEERQYTTRYHYADGRLPSTDEPMSLIAAHTVLNGILHTKLSDRDNIIHAEVVQRVILNLRDGSTLIGPWNAYVMPQFPGHPEARRRGAGDDAEAAAEDLDRADLLVDEREFDLAVRVGKLEGFAHWLVALDEPGNEDRRTVTLTRIIDRARKALEG